MNNYTSKDVLKLNDRDSMRERPTMYIGSTDNDGVEHICLEVISNSIDEYTNGSGDTITIKMYKDGSISIRDNARGIPVGMMADGKLNSLESVFTQLHSGGKFNAKGTTGYNTAGGLHGIGLKAANFLSDWLNCTVLRDGKEYEIKFEHGFKIDDIKVLREDVPLTQTGTFIHFKPSDKIFTDTTISLKSIANIVRNLSFLVKGLKFEIYDERDERISEKPLVIKSENGLLDYISEVNKDKKVINKPFYMSTRIEDINCEVELALQYNDSQTTCIRMFTNNIPNPDEGTHWTGFSSAFTRAVNEYAEKAKLLKDKDERFSGQDLREGMVLVVNVKIPEPKFNGQTKSQLKDPRGRACLEKTLPNEIKAFFEKDKIGIKNVINKMLVAQRANKAAKRVKDSFAKGVKGKDGEIKRRMELGDKLTECNGKKPELNEVFIVEGESAGSGFKTVRKAETQAVLGLRGKITNSEKVTDLNKLLNDKGPIKDLVLGLGTGLLGDFDIKKLKYHKVIIATDADVDGSHIRTLILTFFFNYMRPLIEGGYVYASVPPLYRLKNGKEIIYVKDDEELKTYDTSKYTVTRFKGLGEMDSKDLGKTIVDAETRVIRQITIEDVEEAQRNVNILMGKDVEPRRNFIIENAKYSKIDI